MMGDESLQNRRCTAPNDVQPGAVIAGLGLVVVAAGSSTRMEGVDKIWAQLGTTTVLVHSVGGLAPWAEQTIVVVRRDHRMRAQEELGTIGGSVRVVEGGQRRQDSVLAGLEALSDMRMVAIHDGARPFATRALLDRGVTALRQYDGAVPGTKLTDTVKQVDLSDRIVQTVDRSVLRLVQTPQVFYTDVLLMCHRSEERNDVRVTDDAALLEACMYQVGVFPGAERNFKITTEMDLELARFLVRDDTGT